MHIPKSPMALAGALLAAAAAGAFGLQGVAQASNTQLGSAHQDDDQDGLDNAMELRLGFDPYSANADGDAYDDLGELVLGLDPRHADSRVGRTHVRPSVTLEAYQAGQSLVLQASVLRKSDVQDLHFYIARQNPAYPAASNVPVLTARLGQAAYGRFVDRAEVRPSGVPQYEIASLRLILPADPLVRFGAFAIAAVAEVDNGVKVGDQIRFTLQNDRLMELRDFGLPAIGAGLQGGTSGTGGGRGGLFPADPLAAAPPGENLTNMVCVQELGASAVSGVGVLYTVSSAYCDTLFAALCLAGCASTAGDSFVGLDLPSLLQ